VYILVFWCTFLAAKLCFTHKNKIVIHRMDSG